MFKLNHRCNKMKWQELLKCGEPVSSYPQTWTNAVIIAVGCDEPSVCVSVCLSVLHGLPCTMLRSSTKALTTRSLSTVDFSAPRPVSHSNICCLQFPQNSVEFCCGVRSKTQPCHSSSALALCFFCLLLKPSSSTIERSFNPRQQGR